MIQLSCASYTYIPYHVDDLGVPRTVDISGLLPSNSQSDSSHCGSELRKYFKKVLQDIQVAARYCRIVRSSYKLLCCYRNEYKEFFLKQLRKSREKLKGEELKKVSDIVVKGCCYGDGYDRS